MSDHQVRISVEADEAASHRDGCNQRVQKLKAKFPRSEDPTSESTLLPRQLFGEKNSEILKLQKIVQNGNVDSFVDELEQLCLKKKLPLSAIFDQVTPNGDSLLHVAAFSKKAEIAKLIAHHFPELITKTNIDGDTALHVAAKSESSSVIEAILSQCNTRPQTSASSSENNQDEQIITRLTNECGNTTLHEAVSSEHVEGVISLFEADKCMAHYMNKFDRSPLYLAVLSSNKQIVNVLLEAPFLNNKPLPNYHGNSPLHAAIYKENAVLLEEIVNKRSDLTYLRDEQGGTPLHYAATTGYVEGICILLKKSSVAALECNTKGHFPIHLASKFGYIKVLQEFLRQDWYDLGVLLNKKGQNILHVAAKNGQISVVNYILRHTKLTHLLINKKDINGNTPLHLAAKNLDLFTVLLLTKEKRTNVNLMNNKSLTAKDIAWVNSDTPMTIMQELLINALNSAGAKVSEKTKNMRKSRQALMAKKIRGRIEALMLMTILIVTVTFAAGFTVPGGVYSSDDPNPRVRGMAVLGHKTWFKVFAVTDTIAMYSSTLASLLLLAAHLGKYDLINAYVMTLFLVRLALWSMTLAFMAATSLVMGNVSLIPSFFICIGFLSLYGILGPLLPWYIPKHTISSHYTVLLLFLETFRSLGLECPMRSPLKHQSSASGEATAEEQFTLSPTMPLSQSTSESSRS